MSDRAKTAQEKLQTVARVGMEMCADRELEIDRLRDQLAAAEQEIQRQKAIAEARAKREDDETALRLQAEAQLREAEQRLRVQIDAAQRAEEDKEQGGARLAAVREKLEGLLRIRVVDPTFKVPSRPLCDKRVEHFVREALALCVKEG